MTIISDSNKVVVETFKKASCSRGWLKQINQIIFAVTTILCFLILMTIIVREALDNYMDEDDDDDGDDLIGVCYTGDCEIVCRRVSDTVAQDIAESVEELNLTCRMEGTSLMLIEPEFTRGIIPANFLSDIQVNITSLSISGGNVHDIDYEAFSSNVFTYMEQFVLELMSLNTFHSGVLEHFVHLKHLMLRRTTIQYLEEDALAHAKNIEGLLVQRVGAFDPRSITGYTVFEKLLIVSFTQNDFGSVIKNNTFLGLRACQQLILSSSQITSIEAGAFDPLQSLQFISLSFNLIKSLPTGTFDATPLSTNSIELQWNIWHCDCGLEYIRQLYADGYLTRDPVCYTPLMYRGRHLSTFEHMCEQNDTFYPRGNYVLISDYVNNDSSTHDLRDECVEEDEVVIYCDGDTSRLTAKETFQRELTHSAIQNSVVLYESVGGDNFTLYLKILLSNISQYYFIIFKGDCHTENYCFTSITNFVRIKNLIYEEQYIFCLIDKTIEQVEPEYCFHYYLSVEEEGIWGIVKRHMVSIIFTVCIVICASLSGFVVLMAIKRNPVLLKGNKRIIIVKRKYKKSLVLYGITKD